MRTHELLEPHAITGVALSPDGQTMAVCIYNYGMKLYESLTAEYRNGVRGQFSHPIFSPNGTWAVGIGNQVSFVPVDTTSNSATWARTAGRHAAAFHDEQTLTMLSRIQTVELVLPPNSENFTTYFEATAKVRNLPHTVAPGLQFDLQLPIVGLDSNRLALVHHFAGTTPSGTTYFILTDLADFRHVARVEGLHAFSEFGSYFHAGDWFAVSTRAETTIYNKNDISTPPPSLPIETRPRGILRTLFASIVGTPQRHTEDPEMAALPRLQPRLRVPVVGVPPSENLPFAFVPGGGAFLCRGKQSIIEMRETATGYVLKSWRFGKAWPRAMAVSPDGLTAIAATRGGSVVIWDLQ